MGANIRVADDMFGLPMTKQRETIAHLSWSGMGRGRVARGAEGSVAGVRGRQGAASGGVGVSECSWRAGSSTAASCSQEPLACWFIMQFHCGSAASSHHAGDHRLFCPTAANPTILRHRADTLPCTSCHAAVALPAPGFPTGSAPPFAAEARHCCPCGLARAFGLEEMQ